jgi:hypothetical protein
MDHKLNLLHLGLQKGHETKIQTVLQETKITITLHSTTDLEVLNLVGSFNFILGFLFLGISFGFHCFILGFFLCFFVFFFFDLILILILI